LKTTLITSLSFAVLQLTFAGGALAAQQEDPAAPPPLPEPRARSAPSDEDVPIPPKVQDERSRLEPTVEIRRDEEDNLIEEYSLEGRVYMVKVTPKNGPAYYYLDDDGDGQLELSERDRAAYPVKPVYWKIKEWK